MKPKYSGDGDWSECIQLWICRIFASSKAMDRLVRRDRLGDEDVGFYLGFMDDDEKFDAGRIKAEIHELHQSLEKRRADGQLPAFCRRNFEEFGRTLNLNTTERRILPFLCLQIVESVLGDATNLLRCQSKREYIRLLARALDVPVKIVAEASSGGSTLIRSGLVKWESSIRRGNTLTLANDPMAEVLLSEDFSIEKAIRTVAMPAPAPTLRYRDFPHIRETLDYLRPYLRSVLADATSGANIYIHGAPGTGKSELARVLAREMRARLFEVSTEDSDGDSVNGARRIESMRAAQSLLSTQRALLVFDEAEDIFTGQSFFHRSLASERKGWMNRFLENNRIPTIWISNSRHGLDPAFVRRFDFVFELATPPKRQRLRSFRRICQNSIPGKTVRRLAECENLAPAVVARAQRVSKRIATVQPEFNQEEVLLHLVGKTLKAQGHGSGALGYESAPVPKVFDLGFLNSDAPLDDITSQFDGSASCRMCLFGPPGTGKTTFGHWLADRLDLQINVKKVSDILSPYVGETEQNIARIFQEAREESALLMLDEVDSFLQDRRRAHRSWEVTQVNEFLTQMERFEGIFIASTNLVDGLDQASLRRFDLKIGFDYLRGGQVRALFKRHCRDLRLGSPGSNLLERAALIENATPGDFANAARQHRFRRFEAPSAFLQAIVDECGMKEGGNRRQAGF